VSLAAGGELALLDGVVARADDTVIPATDDGLLRGDGAFEVIRVYDGRPFALASHLDRLESSAASLMLELPAPRDQLERDVAELLHARGGEAFDGCLRIVLTRGGRRLMLTEPLPTGPERARLAFVTYAPSRILDGVKSLSYAANMLASRIARDRGFDEALLVTPHGRVLEAPTSSLFWVDGDGRLCTPPLDDHILASITRDRVMRLMDTVECPVTTDELLGSAAEAFLASTTREVMPVGAIEDRDLGQPGELTLRARDLLRACIEEELAAG
jgi:branched-chain amino acid aminotransferase